MRAYSTLVLGLLVTVGSACGGSGSSSLDADPSFAGAEVAADSSGSADSSCKPEGCPSETFGGADASVDGLFTDGESLAGDSGGQDQASGSDSRSGQDSTVAQDLTGVPDVLAPACQNKVCDPTGDTPCSASQCSPSSGQCEMAPINEGGPCSDGQGCTVGDFCSAGACAPGGSPGCDDGLWCTGDGCTPTSPDGYSCEHPIAGGSCLISGTCFEAEAKNPADGCERCKPAVSNTSWTYDLGLPEADSQPPGTAAKRFDVATINCSSCGKTCPQTDDHCMCQDEWMGLNYSSQQHFVGVGTEKYRKALWAQGNVAAVYVNSFNDGWTETTGAQRAAEIHAKAEANFPSGVPKWFLVNEISASQWPANAAYRDFVVEMASHLNDDFGRSVIVFAPFQNPGNAWPQWAKLAEKAYVGAECYKDTNGKEINASGNSVDYVKGVYQKTLDSYASVGVPKNRVFITDHYANNGYSPDSPWGRCGVSKQGWKNAIKTRAAAIQQLDVAGFVSYGWGNNEMLDDSATLLEFEATYASDSLP